MHMKELWLWQYKARVMGRRSRAFHGRAGCIMGNGCGIRDTVNR